MKLFKKAEKTRNLSSINGICLKSLRTTVIEGSIKRLIISVKENRKNVCLHVRKKTILVTQK